MSKAKTDVLALLKEGIDYTPFDDMVLYAQSFVPTLSEEDTEGVPEEVLEAMYEGDIEGEVTERKLWLLKKGDKCEKAIEPGDQIAVRGHAYKITTNKGVFYTVREYDVIGKYDA